MQYFNIVTLTLKCQNRQAMHYQVIHTQFPTVSNLGYVTTRIVTSGYVTTRIVTHNHTHNMLKVRRPKRVVSQLVWTQTLQA